MIKFIETVMIDPVKFDYLADQEGSDKGASGHAYGSAYNHFLSSRIKSVQTIVELGVGGASFRGSCGGSLRLWQGLFPEATIIGVDSDKSCMNIQKEKIKIIIEEQDKKCLPKKIMSATNGQSIDLIIDDASHVPEKTIRSFHNLFPILDVGGLYIIEDTHCSYEEDFGSQRVLFENFLFWLISVIDLGGEKLSKHNFQDFKKVDNAKVLDFWQKSIESVHIRRGILAIKRR